MLMGKQILVHNGDIENYLTQEQLIQYDEQRINYYLEKQQYEEEQWLEENGYTIDYSQEILPPSPSFLPQFAKEFTRQRQHIYQWIRKPYRLTI